LQTSIAVADCLVASPDDSRLSRLADAAETAGWQVVRASNVEAASDFSDRIAFRLAIVDLAPCRQLNEERFRCLAQRLALNERSLLAVVGREGDAPQEIFARSLACWLFLPDIGEASELTSILRHARETQKTIDPNIG
jgi:hypothetical protein